jgi:hypothetical protein
MKRTRRIALPRCLPIPAFARPVDDEDDAESPTGVDAIRAWLGLPARPRKDNARHGTLQERIRALLPVLLTGSYSVRVRKKDGARVLDAYGVDPLRGQVHHTIVLGDAATADEAVGCIKWMLAEVEE